MTYTEKLADLIVETKSENLPPDVVHQAKIIVMDTIGVGIGGYCTDVGKQIVAMARNFPGSPGAALIGDGSKVSEVFATWANSSLSNLMDMDETFSGTAHLGNCVISTAMAVGERVGASGKEVLHALVLGFETGSRIMRYLWPSPMKGVRIYLPSTWQVLAATVTAGKLLELNREEMVHAFGLAGTVPPIPLDMKKFVERPMGFGKNVFGWTTMTGVFWTILAKMGMKGTPNILDGDGGFWFLVGSDQYNYEKLLEGWGQKYNILDTKFKPYPSCTWGHSSIDATKIILEQHLIKPEEIEIINIKTLERSAQFLSDTEIKTIFDAQFSLPYALAMLLLGQKAGPEWLSEENMFHNEKVKEIEKKIKIQVDSDAEKVFAKESGEAMMSTVEIKTNQGNVYREQVKYPKGSPRNPFTPEELTEKFKIVTSSLFSEKKIAQLLKEINRLDEIENISDFTGLLHQE